jgi:anti-anti-sigma regulatory factor
MANAPPRAVFQLVPQERGIRLVDVEGQLPDRAAPRWRALLSGVIDEAPRGIVVDLRGCPWVDPICLSEILAASSTLRASGAGGVKVVTYPGSPLGRRLGPLAAELPAYASATEALVSFGDPQ